LRRKANDFSKEKGKNLWCFLPKKG